MPNRQVLCTKCRRPIRLRGAAASKPHRMFDSRTQSVMASRSSSVNPNRARTGAAWARLSTWLAVARLPANGEQLRGHAEQRVGLGQRAVGEPDPQPVCGMRAVHHVAEPEVGDDQRRIGLDVGAHHHDVARLQRRVVGQQAEQHLAQHVDLPRRAVAAVHLHRAVAFGEHAALWPNARWRRCRIAASPSRVSRFGRRRPRYSSVAGLAGRLRCSSRRSRPSVASSGCWAARSAGVVAAGDRAVDAGERLPQVVAGVRQPQVQVVVGGQRVEQLDVGARQPGVPEQRQPCGQVGRAFAQPGDGLLLPDVRGIGVDAVDQRPPQFRLPGQVGVEVWRVAVQPVDQQLRTLPGVGREQAGQPPGHRIPPAAAQLGLVVGRLEVAQMRCQRAAPRLVEPAVDDLQQRPRHGVG